jgi:hypothetical protein
MNSLGKLTAFPLLRRSFAPAAALILAATAAHATDYPTTVLGDKPVAYYRFEELPGATTAVDSSPNHLDASYVYDTANQVPELGLAGIDTNSIAFAGEPSSDYGNVDIPYNVLLAPLKTDGEHGAPFSIECWVQAYSLNNNGAYLSIVGMFGAYSTGAYANASGWLLGQTPGPAAGSGSQWLFNMKNAGFLNTTKVVPLQWTHLVGTFDGTNENFYVDGVLTGSAGASGYLADEPLNPGADGQVGAVPNAGLVPSGPYGTWNGGVDEVAFYTNALSLAQITNHYQVGLGSFRITTNAPGILTQPSDETNFAGTAVTFSVTADGTPPLYYQWVRAGSGAIAGATNSTYTIVPSYPADNNAQFHVTITNIVGLTNSATVTLSVETNLLTLAPPFSITRNVGSHAAFRVAAGGAQPVGYQWSISTNNGTSFSLLPGQVADTLWLTNVQLSQSGYQYAVVASNPFISASNSASLTVVPRTENVTLTGYGAIVAADKPVAYYRLDESTGATTAIDAVGSFDGTYSTNAGSIVWGILPGIPNDTDPAVDLQDNQTTNTGLGGVVDIPYALELNPWGAWSVEYWVRPDAVDGVFRSPMSSMQNLHSGNNVSGWNTYEYGSVPSYWTLVLYNGGSGGGFYTDFANNPKTNTWFHTVVTDDTTNISFYVNAELGASVSTAAAGYVPNGTNGDASFAGADEVIGQRTDLAFFGANAGMDEVAFYNYALSPTQIMSHYLNKVLGPTLGFTQSSGSITLSWSSGVLLSSPTVAGPYTPVSGAVSPYTVPTTAAQKFYELQVTP